MIPGLCCALAFLAAGVAFLAPAWFAGVSRRQEPLRSSRLPAGAMAGTAAVVLAGAYWSWQIGSFYNRYWTGFSPGGVRGESADTLMGYHLVLLLLVVIAAGVMFRRRLQPYRPGTALSAVGGLLTAAACATTLVLTVPRSGDEGIILWLILVQVMGIAVLALVVTSIVLLIHGLLQWRRLSGPPRPLCPTCGYNLTGNVSGRCPECGTEIPPEILAMLGQRRHERSAGTSGATAPAGPVSAQPSWPTILTWCCGGFSLLMIAVNLMRISPLIGFMLFRAIPLGSLRLSLVIRLEPALVSVATGVLLLVATYGLSNRRRWAAIACMTWAVLHMAIGVADLVCFPSTMAGMSPTGIHRWSGLTTNIAIWKAVWSLALPIVLLVWLSRPSIRHQVATWGRTPGAEQHPSVRSG